MVGIIAQDFQFLNIDYCNSCVSRETLLQLAVDMFHVKHIKPIYHTM